MTLEEVTRDLGFNILEGNMEPVLGVSWGDYLKLRHDHNLQLMRWRLWISLGILSRKESESSGI